MPLDPINPINPRGQIRAADLERLAAETSAQDRTTGAGNEITVARSGAGFQIGVNLPLNFWALITGSTLASVPVPHSWDQLLENEDGTFSVDGEGRSGTFTSYPAFATDGTQIADNTIVRLYLGQGGEFFLFEPMGVGTSTLDLTVREVDTSPTITNVNVIEFDQDDGFVVTNPGVGIARIDIGTLNPATSFLVVEEVDGSPSVTAVHTIQFDQSDGFVVSSPGAGIARIDIGILPPGSSFLTVREVDLSPSVSGVHTIEFDQDDLLQVSNPAAGVARIDITGLTTSIPIVTSAVCVSGILTVTAVTATFQSGVLATVSAPSVAQYACCTCCICTISCCNCTEIPLAWSLSVEGVMDGTCEECEGYNGDFFLVLVDDCAWHTDDNNPCGGEGSFATYQLFCDEVNQEWVLYANGTANVVAAEYRLAFASWDCTGTNVMDYVTDDGQCISWPATMTLVPV